MEAFDSKALRHLLAAVRTGSIRGASDLLHVAPSAVSRQISDIEHRLGVSLFARTSRGVVLTDAGHMVVEHALRVRQDQELLTEQLGSLKSARRGVVRVGCGEGYIADLIGNGLRSFTPVHPGVRVIISVAGTDGLISSVSNGDVDLVVVYNPLIDANLQSMAISRDSVQVVAPPGHPLLRRSSVSLAETFSYPYALLTKGYGVRDVVGRVASDNGMPVTPAVETSSFEVLRKFVTAGLGITFLPRFVVAAELARDEVGVVELTDVLLTQASTHLVVRGRRRLSVAVERLADHLTSQMVAFQDGRSGLEGALSDERLLLTS